MNELTSKILTLLGNGLNINSIPLSTLLLKGGWIMLPIVMLSFITVYIIFYKLIELANTTKYSEQWLKSLKNSLLMGDREQVKVICKKRKNVSLSKVIVRSIKRSVIDKNLYDIEGMVEAIGKDEIYKLETKISTLGIISGSAPMMGFLGTVTGLIQAFIKISQYKSQINPSIISGGIYEAMITTVAGLIVGIAAYISYNYFIIRIKKVTHDLEYRLADLMYPIKTCIEKNKL